MMLDQVGIEVLPQGDLDIPAADEPHPTFVENALEKARHASRASGLPALADDSGICVEALMGAPGIHSARYAGEPANDANNNKKLIETLQGEENRSAHYVCALVIVRYALDPEPIIAMGYWHGQIIDIPQGSGGFGYDPHFFLPDLGMTAAELSPEDKNRLGHRGLALKQLVHQLMSQSGADK
jgi:XTP/dITP diphosphohydrolase